jgi:UDP-glucose:(heptosyl)LPS alpha-1,3-glucosyltransferase
MKLALIRRQYSATGGAELYLQRLLGALVQSGHEVHLFAESWEGPPPEVKFHPIHCAGSRASRGWEFANAVQAALKQDRFDCVFSLERTLQQDVYRAGDGAHRVWLQRRHEFASWWRKPFTRFGAFHRNMLRLEAQTLQPRNTRHIIANSSMVQREIIDHFAFPAERIHIVRNGVDVPRFQRGKRAETRARFGVTDVEFLLLFVGSGWERKGLRFVIQGLAELATRRRERAVAPAGTACPRPKLLVVGKGRQPASVPEGLIFAGPMRDVEDAYAAADLFVTLPIYEPAANVVFEALSAGLPVITTVYNGAAEVIQEGITGNVIKEFWRPQVVAETIRGWIERPRRVEVETAAFSLERNVSETLAVLEGAAKEKGP